MHINSATLRLLRNVGLGGARSEVHQILKVKCDSTRRVLKIQAMNDGIGTVQYLSRYGLWIPSTS